MNPQEVIRLLSVLTLASNIGILSFILLYFSQRLGLAKSYWKRYLDFFTKRAVFFSFIVSVTATSGSLYLSEVAGFTPCILCWYQRIFMYPLVLILGTALVKKRKDVWQYVLPLCFVGIAIAAYHYFLQIFPQSFAPCSAVGFSVSCTERFFTYFGYITIPFMSLSAFLLITIGMLLTRFKSSEKVGK